MSSIVNVDAIPEEMKALKNWVLWKYEDRKNGKGEIKKTKVPYQVNGKKAESTTPDTWGSFENVIKTLDRLSDKFNGIGFVFSEDSGIMGLDFDHVKNPETGEWDPEAIKEIKSLNSYAEMSPSGTGAHVICIAKIPGPHRREGPREMYESGRYFTVTGDHIKGTTKAVNEVQGEVNALYYNWFNHRNKKTVAEHKPQPEKKIKLSDSEIIDIASRAKNSDKFKRLYNGSIAGYTSQSEADQALCSLIAFYTQDPGQIDSIFRGSGLYRADKWEVVNYRDRTINKALQGVTETYNPEKKGKSGKRKPEKIIVHFDEVANEVMKNDHFFTMRDGGQLYHYRNGVYKNDDTEPIIDTKIRDMYVKIFKEKWRKENTEHDFPEHIPEATVRFVKEAIAYIKAYTHIPRDQIDEIQERFLNFKNCLFDLEKWDFLEHDPKIKTICQMPVKYDPDAECPQINKFINEVAKQEDIDFLEEWVGYCMTTDVSYQKALMLYGIPGTGKSVFATLLETFIGTENTSNESLQKIEEDKYRSAKLYGKRVNVCSDIPNSKLHKAEMFKKLVSGLDTVDAENKYESSFTFRNKAKLTFSANKIPEGPKDPAFYERFCLVEFGNKFRGEKGEDRRLIQKLTSDAELSGLLNIALKGLRRLHDNDQFSYTKTFEETEKEYRLNSNPVVAFMEDCTVISDQDIDGTVLYLAYSKWATDNNLERLNNVWFSKKLKAEGYTNHRENVTADGRKKRTMWDNIQLKPIEINYTDGGDEADKNESRTGNGQVDEKNTCPKKTSDPITNIDHKNDSGQVKNTMFNIICDSNQEDNKKMDKVENENIQNNVKLPNIGNFTCPTCPKTDFFDNERHGQVNSPNLSVYVSESQKNPLSSNSATNNSVNNISEPEIMRTDMKNLARSKYNGVVESVNEFVGVFNSLFPGYKNKYGHKAVLQNAERLSSRGWK